jgi:hypothetical protein
MLMISSRTTGVAVMSIHFRIISKFFLFMTNRFQGGMFNKVRWLVMDDTRPFENELFKIISQDFPFLKSLAVVNRAS